MTKRDAVKLLRRFGLSADCPSDVARAIAFFCNPRKKGGYMKDDSVKRFGFGAVDLLAAENPSGAFVLYTDYDRATARIDALELEVKHWQAEAQSYKPAWDAVKHENEALRQEIKTLRR